MMQRSAIPESSHQPVKVVRSARHFSLVAALGIGCFGSVDLAKGSDGFGSILGTTKPGWSHIDVLGTLASSIGVPTAIESDVGAAVIAESERGVGVGERTVRSITVGTGIGGAVVVDGEVLHGHGHSELGHIPTERLGGDVFQGLSVYHDACLEGMALGSAIETRRIHGDVDPYTVVAGYLAQLVQTVTSTFAPDVIARVVCYRCGGVAPHGVRLKRKIDRNLATSTSSPESSMRSYVSSTSSEISCAPSRGASTKAFLSR